MKVVIDADQMVYSCGFAAEGEPLANALHLVKKAHARILENSGADEYEMFIGGDGNFREEVAITATYKGTRTGRKPEFYKEIRQFMIDNLGAQQVDGMEADDRVSMLLWQDFCKADGDKDLTTIIVSSGDKDLNNTPGWHYHPVKETKYWVSPKQAERHFYYQMLAGDRVDNIKGLPYCTEFIRDKYKLSKAAAKGCGDGSAKKIMEASAYFIEAVYECYCHWALSAGLDLTYLGEYMAEQGGLLWMVREFDALGDPVLWKPDLNLLAESWSKARGDLEDHIGPEHSVNPDIRVDVVQCNGD